MKNTIKRTVKYLLLFVAVIMMSFVINTETLAAEEYIDGYYTYTVTDGEATIVNVDEAICGEVFIPEALGGYPVVSFNSRNNCDKITTLIIPYSVKAIETYAFVDWNSIAAFIVDSNNEYFSSVDGVLFNKDQTVLIQYPTGNKRTTYRVPNGVVSLQDMTHCKYLVNLILPDSVESIGHFADSTGLKTLTMTNSVKYIPDNAFFSTYLDCIYFVGTEVEWNSLVEDYEDTTGTPYLQRTKKTFVDKTHLKNVEINVVDPTCTTEGVKTTNCLCGCGYTLYETLQKKHNYEYEIVTGPTCTLLGYKKYTCSLCGDSYGVEISSIKHIYECLVVEPTCTSCGCIKYTCSLCGDSYNIETPILEHTYSSLLIEPTCTSRGYEKYVCSSCGDTYTINYTPMLEHDYKDVFTVEPTCVSNGTKNIICSTCGYCKSSNVYVPSLGHIDENKDSYCDRENCKEAIESEPFTEGIYTYTVKAGAATIKAVDNTISGDIVIPSTLGGYPVVAIGDEAFAESFNITSVVVPEGVTYIDEDAFALCYRMESVTLPESLETIENWVFGACLSLKEIVLPESVVNINDSAFDSCLSLEKIVVKNAEASIGEYICYTTLLPKDIPTSEWVEKYITAYEAMMNGDENAETLMAELESQTTILENEVAVLPELTIYSHDPSTAKTYADENGIPFKNISELEEPHTCTFGEWYTETEPTVFSEGVSKRVCECGEFETKSIAKLESASAKDETTKVEITYTEENFESEVEIVVSEEEINANIVFGDEFENYKAYDISLEAGGEKIQPKGYVTVKLPIPEGFNADSTVVYYVDDSGNKTKLESTTENGYIVFETDHFSEYVLVDESSRIEPPHVHSYTASITKEATCTENGTTTYTCSCGDSYNETIEAIGHDFDGSKCKNCDYDKADTCGCNCHKGGFMGFIWKIINFFNKLFKSKHYCACGAKHW